MNEWEFTAQFASWINERLAIDPDLPFSQAKVEQTGKGTRKRRDLTLLDKNEQVALTGEIKLPYQKDGGSPFNSRVVEDARAKAKDAKSKFFFTWNVNQFLLWETKPSDIVKKNPNYMSWDVTNIHSENHLELNITFDAIREFLPRFLSEFAKIYQGLYKLGAKSPDERFIETIESYLHQPILLTVAELTGQYKKPHFKRDLDHWMRDILGWTIFDDPEGIRDNLERAAKFSCYALVNKLVFHEALLKKYSPDLKKLSVSDSLDQGEALRNHLESCFAQAQIATGDYETVFGEEHRVIGNRIPFYADRAVPHWRDLINQIHSFDFSKLDYEIIGNIFERLISPEERRKYGQFYTRSEVVDLINSFCIRTGDEKVMDPACGGGTFLVRAYARKKQLQIAREHHQLISDLYGLDIDLFAANLTTINLATRDLVDEENYPLIARGDFFDVSPQKSFLSLPLHRKTKGHGPIKHREVFIPPLDAVVGNPPYIRQELLRRSQKTDDKGRPERGTKDYYQRLAYNESKAILSGRSDIHCYFWPHAMTFLKEDGYLCFLTSSQWLDVEYGFRLQEWIQRHFRIIAILESRVEPWFVGARVGTTITILQREPDEDKRRENRVRFVQLWQPLKGLLAHDGTGIGAVMAADRFRDEILGYWQNTTHSHHKVRLVRQGELWDQGVRLGQIMKKDQNLEENDNGIQNGGYYGGKWGIFLRAPDLWFELLNQYGDRFAPLGDLVRIKRGITSGKDSFFFPIDVSQECLDKYRYDNDFQENYGVSRKEVASGKVKLVKCGEGRGEIRPLEAKYLAPEVHSLMEIDGFTVKPEDCSRMILLVNKKKSQLKGTYALDYINWGESQKIHEGSTCAARVTENKQWYDLTGHERGTLFWPMAQQYKHNIPLNESNLICNHRLFDIFTHDYDPLLIGGILNSTWAVLSKYQYGRPVGVEGNLDTEVIDVKMMLVPDPRKAAPKALKRVAEAFEKMKPRQALQFLSERSLREMAYVDAGKQRTLAALSNLTEMSMEDRHELDDAVLEMIGVKGVKQRRALLKDLYFYLNDFFAQTRKKEELAIANKKQARRRGPAKPRELAEQIYKDLMVKNDHLLARYDPDFLGRDKDVDTFEVPEKGAPKKFRDMFSHHGVAFYQGQKKIGFVQTQIPAQDDLIVLLAQYGIRRFVSVPHESEECRQLFQRYEKFLKQREGHLRLMIEERTADKEMQEKVYQALIAILASGKYKYELARERKNRTRAMRENLDRE